MITIEEAIVVDAQRRVTLTLPESVSSGTHHVLLVISDAEIGNEDDLQADELSNFPVFHGLELKDQNLSRSVLYGDGER